jgi:hypothetical protein
MKKRLGIALLLMAVALVALPTKARGQVYEFSDSTGRYRVEYVRIVEEERREYDTIRWRHNFRLTLGTPSLVQIHLLKGTLYEVEETKIYTPQSASDRLAEYRYYTSPTYMVTPITIEYSYYINRWLSVGGRSTLTAFYNDDRNIATNEVLRKNCTFVASAIVSVRFEYMRRKYVQLYSAVGAGVAARFDREVGVIIPMYDLTYFGIVVGKNLYGFAEVGAGVSGFARAGIGYRF